jgi:hypothetical protein
MFHHRIVYLFFCCGNRTFLGQKRKSVKNFKFFQNCPKIVHRQPNAFRATYGSVSQKRPCPFFGQFWKKLKISKKSFEKKIFIFETPKLSKKWTRPSEDTLPYVARNAFGWRWTIFGQFFKKFQKKKVEKFFTLFSFFGLEMS